MRPRASLKRQLKLLDARIDAARLLDLREVPPSRWRASALVPSGTDRNFKTT
jgi:hypothetical protein